MKQAGYPHCELFKHNPIPSAYKEKNLRPRLEWSEYDKKESVLVPSNFTLCFRFYDLIWSLSKWKYSRSPGDWIIQFIFILFYQLKGRKYCTVLFNDVCRLHWHPSSHSRKSFFFCCLSLKSAHVFKALLFLFSCHSPPLAQLAVTSRMQESFHATVNHPISYC